MWMGQRIRRKLDLTTVEILQMSKASEAGLEKLGRDRDEFGASLGEGVVRICGADGTYALAWAPLGVKSWRQSTGGHKQQEGRGGGGQRTKA